MYQKSRVCIRYSLPILKNVLPKTKGFNSCLQEPRSSIDAVYDITNAYKHRLPTFLYNVYGIDPSKIHTIATCL
ncbi:probable 1-acyl-sn-glycerol-3-phosphate acyltransferase 5 [Setaria viridis]|uniref:probable 1-acyl-sn-glycerol-3-phosphate acyltransferase 5 n=1 Tax=Setaria viridis TaxID=4556 RepID=UPI003B3B5B8A